MLGQCRELVHLNLWGNWIGADRAGDFWLHNVVKPLAPVCRHLALLALWHLFSRQATRKSDILYAYSAVAFGLALSL